jgi:uncharacterized YigZ family protein
MSRYPIPKGTTRIEYRQSNSRFITTMAPVFTVGEAKSFLQSIRNEMPDATHHVYAYIVGFGSSVTEGMSDDGEPSGTSGPPTLAVLRGSGIGDVIVVITRYFGGTKLGTGGLVTAYSSATKEVIQQAPTEMKVHRIEAALTTPYHHFERIKKLILEFEGIIDNEAFATDVTLNFRLPKEHLETLRSQIQDMTAGSVAVATED